MERKEIIENLKNRGHGEIYLGVVGSVRTGKSTFIKKLIEQMIVPNINDEFLKKQCLDEIPQTSGGKNIMTIEPKFVPSNGALINVDGMETKIKLVDCVGFVTPNAVGYLDQDGNPRMVKTPWYSDEIPFVEAAEIGTEKVIRDHATIGVVITTDASFTELSREDYLEPESKVINELISFGKPFVVIVNTNDPTSSTCNSVVDELRSKYDVPILPVNIDKMNDVDITNILKETLYEYPVDNIEIKIPDWVAVLPNTHYLKEHYLNYIKESIKEVKKVRDVDGIINAYSDSEYIKKAYISKVDSNTGIVELTLDSDDALYDRVLSEFMDGTSSNRASMLKIFANYDEMVREQNNLSTALKMVKNTGYGIVYPELKDMRLETPEIIKQGGRYGVKLKAVAESIHMMKIDVESVFEPIIGSELQSKELIDHIMKDYETDPTSIWKSEIFGRSLDEIVKEGIQAKLSMMPDQTRYKLQGTVSKIVNKGSNNLIALVF